MSILKKITILITEVLAIVVIILAMPLIGLIKLFEYLIKKIYRHSVHIMLFTEEDHDAYIQLAKKNYPRWAYFSANHYMQTGLPEAFDHLVGVTFYFARSQDAVHFKLMHLID